MPQGTEGQPCADDYQCVNAAGCLEGRCKQYGTLDNYQRSDNELICKSGFISEGESWGSGTVCMPAPAIIDKAGPEYRCASVQDSCTYQSGAAASFTLPCKCGLTPEGDAFCPRVYNQNYTQLLFDVSKRLSQGTESQCHTLDRHDIYACLMLNARTGEDVALLEEFIVATYERERNNEIRDNDGCMQGHSKVSQYWDAKKRKTHNRNFHGAQTVADAAVIKTPSFWLLILYLGGFFYLTYPAPARRL